MGAFDAESPFWTLASALTIAQMIIYKSNQEHTIYSNHKNHRNSSEKTRRNFQNFKTFVELQNWLSLLQYFDIKSKALASTEAMYLLSSILKTKLLKNNNNFNMYILQQKT